MWWPVPTLLVLGGCAQIVGIETTQGRPDARIDAAMNDAPGPPPCFGGDARGVDPVTGACYVFFATPMIRDAARSACRGLGATTRLASIQSASENALITNLVGTADVFLGGSDEVTEGVFVWDDGTPVQLTNWNTGEPNNGAGQFEEDCIQLLGSRGGVWNDIPCAPPPVNLGSYPFVCERD
jgi:lectin-like protein